MDTTNENENVNADHNKLNGLVNSYVFFKKLPLDQSMAL